MKSHRYMSGQTAVVYGSAALRDIPVTADFNGDRKTLSHSPVLAQ